MPYPTQINALVVATKPDSPGNTPTQSVATMNNPKLPSQSSQAGFTVIESLLALMMVSILMVALSPVIVLSVATRVQARRVELASRAAKTYVDGVRSGLIDAPPISNQELIDIDAPKTGNLECNQQDTDYCENPTGQPIDTVNVTKEVIKNGSPQNITLEITTLYCVDQDGGGCSTESTTDMIVQAVGYHPQANGNSQDNYDNYRDRGYKLGIRVYKASGFEKSELQKSDQQDSQQAGVAAGVFKSELPLLEMTTAITPNRPNFQDLCDVIGGGGGANDGCD